MGKALFLFIIIAFHAAILTACTSVSIHSDGEVHTSWWVGIPVINVFPNDESVIVKTQSLGLAKSPNLLNLGYMDETYYVSSKNCEIVLFEPEQTNIEYLTSLIGSEERICSTK